MNKPLGKMNKKELFELAKESKDSIRIMDFKLNELTSENEDLKGENSRLRDDLRVWKQTSELTTAALKKAQDEIRKLKKKTQPSKGWFSWLKG